MHNHDEINKYFKNKCTIFPLPIFQERFYHEVTLLMYDMKNNRREINKTRMESLPLQDVAEDVVVMEQLGS